MIDLDSHVLFEHLLIMAFDRFGSAIRHHKCLICIGCFPFSYVTIALEEIIGLAVSISIIQVSMFENRTSASYFFIRLLD